MRRAFTLVEFLIIVGVLLVIAAILFPIFARARRTDRKSSCSSNLKQISLGFRQYTQDYDENYPPVVASAQSGYFGWADLLQPYLKSTMIYQCPSEENDVKGSNPRASGYTDYWMNARVAGRKLEELTHIDKTLICGDGNAGADPTDARYALHTFPQEWLAPSYNRHLEGLNYAFVDGQVKWYKPTAIRLDFSGPTFRWR
jgi:prepilin-type processing-associated H-X9-DG protein